MERSDIVNKIEVLMDVGRERVYDKLKEDWKGRMWNKSS